MKISERLIIDFKVLNTKMLLGIRNINHFLKISAKLIDVSIVQSCSSTSNRRHNNELGYDFEQGTTKKYPTDASFAGFILTRERFRLI